MNYDYYNYDYYFLTSAIRTDTQILGSCIIGLKNESGPYSISYIDKLLKKGYIGDHIVGVL